MATTCKNCGNAFDGNYCNNCGQSAHTHDINFKSIMHEIQHSLLHIDKGILYTTKELFLRPGQTIREYLEGKRVQHFKPFAYIFLLSTIFALLTKLSHKSTFLTEILIGFNNGKADGNSRSDFGWVEQTVQWMSNHYAYTILFILPIFSFASYLCFYKSKYNYFQHLILNSFIAGLRTAINLIILPFTYFVTDIRTNESIDTAKTYLGVGLTIWIFYQFFNTIKPFKRILLAILTYITMVVFIIVLIVGAALITKMLR